MSRKTSKQLNVKEKSVFEVLRKGKEEPIEISKIAGEAFTKKGTGAATKGNSWVRNSMRKLRKLGLARKTSAGHYRWTGKELFELAPKKVEKRTEKKAA